MGVLQLSTDPQEVGHLADLLASDDYSFSDLCDFIRKKAAYLLVKSVGSVVESALIFSIVKHPKRTNMYILAIAGHDITQEDFHFLAQLAKKMNVSTIVGRGPQSIARLWRKFGFQEKAVLFERSL